MATDKPKQHDEIVSEETVSEETAAEEGISLDFVAEDEPQNEPQNSGSEGSLESQLLEQQDRALRLQADMQNLRQRTSRELSAERKYGALPVLRDMLPVVDNIDRAIGAAEIEAAEKESNADGLLEGFRLVQQQLLTLLSQYQCERIEAEGQPFDPEQHEAILQQPSEQPAGTVVMVTQAGYRMHDRMVRAPQVIVSSGPPTADV